VWALPLLFVASYNCGSSFSPEVKADFFSIIEKKLIPEELCGCLFGTVCLCVFLVQLASVCSYHLSLKHKATKQNTPDTTQHHGR
jgi:hypothetical protein